VTGFAALAGLVFISGLSARSIVQPILGVIEHLRESGKTGLLPEFHGPGQNGPGLNRSDERIYEIRELTRAFNRAAAANREAHGKLQRANVEFIESLANALDARDPYTAGHSRRVSQYSVAIAESMALEPGEIETIRIGALLHDIGKIGVSDTILQKPGKLTPEENAVIQQHSGGRQWIPALPAGDRTASRKLGWHRLPAWTAG
jgi:HD-GYP domain-containing protein (c-di-GMP phosphodiesterase class II)